MKVSIITPVFNESNNIKQCFNCILSIEYNDIEWVVVDDGSTDNTIDILKELIASANRSVDIKILQQNNSGASLARRFGINNASGELITILDCDDRLSVDAISQSVIKFKNDDTDLVFYDIAYISDGNEVKRFDFCVDSWPLLGNKAFSYNIDKWRLPGFFVARKSVFLAAYRMKKNMSINNINDDELISKYSLLCSRQVDLCAGVYFYIENANSTTRKINTNYHRIVHTAIEMDDFIRGNNFDDVVKLKSNMNLLSVFYGVFTKFWLWRRALGAENKILWKDDLDLVCSHIRNSPRSFHKNFLSYLKFRVKFYLAKVILIVCRFI